MDPKKEETISEENIPNERDIEMLASDIYRNVDMSMDWYKRVTKFNELKNYLNLGFVDVILDVCKNIITTSFAGFIAVHAIDNLVNKSFLLSICYYAFAYASLLMIILLVLRYYRVNKLVAEQGKDLAYEGQMIVSDMDRLAKRAMLKREVLLSFISKLEEKEKTPENQ